LSLVEDILNYFDNNLSPEKSGTLTNENLKARHNELTKLHDLVSNIKEDLLDSTVSKKVELTMLENSIANLKVENKKLEAEVLSLKRKLFQSKKLRDEARKVLSNQKKEDRKFFIKKQKKTQQKKSKKIVSSDDSRASRNKKRRPKRRNNKLGLQFKTEIKNNQKKTVGNQFVDFFKEGNL